MDDHNSWKRTGNREIDLADLLCRLCTQWKQIMICALAFAVLIGGYGFMRGRGSTDVPETDAAEDICFKAEEQREVMAAVRLEAETRELEHYLDNSVLMQINPYNKDRTVLLYSVSHAKRKELPKITESYLSYITNGGAADALKKSGSKDWDMDQSCLAELLTAYQKAYSSPYLVVMDGAADDGVLTESLFYVELTGKDAGMAKNLALAMQSVLKAYCPVVKDAAGSHKLTLLGSEKGVVTDNSLYTWQHDKKATLSANLVSLKSMTDAFSKEQTAVYQKAIGTEDGQEEAEETEVIGGSGISIKYVILGLIAGAALYCCIYACWYLFRDTVKSTGEMKELYTFPFYGGISLPGKKAMNGQKLSRMRQDAFGQEKARLLNRIRLACKKRGITRLCMASDFSFGRQEQECMEDIVKQLQCWGIATAIAEDAGRDTAMWDTLAETGNVLMVCRIGTTTYQMVDEAMEFYLDNGIDVVGAIAFL